MAQRVGREPGTALDLKPIASQRLDRDVRRGDRLWGVGGRSEVEQRELCCPPVAIGQHVRISPALDGAVRLALFPHHLGQTMLTIQAGRLHTALHLPLATLESLVAAGAVVVALLKAGTDLTPIASPPGSARI